MPPLYAWRVLAVDDDRRLTRLIRSYLEADGLEVVTAHSAGEMRMRVNAEPFDVVILDVHLPDANGLRLLHELRNRQALAVIMLTVDDNENDRARGLELGADDYLGKPFSLRELAARVQAVTRRLGVGIDARKRTDLLTIGALRFDPVNRAIEREGQRIELTHSEAVLLELMASRPNRKFTRLQLAKGLESHNPNPFTRAIDVHIARLRRKIEADPSRPQVIKTVRGLGYMLVDKR